MILKSYSKINLTLSVNKKLKNGLHEIQSFFSLVNLYDEIKIKKIQGGKDVVKFAGKFSKYINKNNNSIKYTLEILRKKKLISDHYSVLINKKIPVYAGLGGGTSNAACLIKYFNKNKIKDDLLSNFEKKIGSDLRLFFHNQGFLNSLKIIKDSRKKYAMHFLLIYPNIKNSTGYIYSKVRKYSPKFKHSWDKINDKKKFIRFIVNKNNDLQSIVENEYPVIGEIISEIANKKGCYFSRLTGSGSVCYGLFKNERSAKAALIRIKSKYPKFWFSVTKTI